MVNDRITRLEKSEEYNDYDRPVQLHIFIHVIAIVPDVQVRIVRLHQINR
jgi:hypothetical protein